MEETGFIERLDLEEYEPEEDLEAPVSAEIEADEEDQLVSYIMSQYSRAEDKKVGDEARFLKAYKNYRGIYGPETKFNDAEKSRIFVKVTKTKVQAAYGQIVQVLSGNGKFPLTVDETKVPEGSPAAMHLNTDPNISGNPEVNKALESPFGINTDKALPPGSTLYRLPAKLEKVQDKLVEGEGTAPGQVTFRPAHIAAKKMERKIHDQLDECQAIKHLRLSAFEMALFGTGIIKGPFRHEKEYGNWDEEGNYAPITKKIPVISHTSVWNFYPDPDANNIDECQYVIERHKNTRSDMNVLKKNSAFDEDAVEEAIEYGPNYQRKYWELEMEDGSSDPIVDRYEVLEYWGVMSKELVEEKGIKIPTKFKNEDMLNVNIWICNGVVIRITLNPFQPERIPYQASPYELNPYSFFGIGVGENMEDTQLLMNGFMRMAVDNAALSGNLIFEVQDRNLLEGQDLELYPGKVFVTDANNAGQTIFPHKIPNVTNENLQLFDKARLLADESTGIPSYSHGQTGVQGIGRTASGISMLMDASNLTTKTVVKNLDDYLIEPLGKNLFAYNMQFEHDPAIKGDISVRARGTEGLMAKEIKSQRLMSFLQVVANPILAPFVNLEEVVRGISEALELDPDRTTNSSADAAIQAELLAKFASGIQGQGMGGQSAPGINPSDPTGAGGGNIGTGGVPTPGTPGFSGNPAGVDNGE